MLTFAMKIYTFFISAKRKSNNQSSLLTEHVALTPSIGKTKFLEDWLKSFCVHNLVNLTTTFFNKLKVSSDKYYFIQNFHFFSNNLEIFMVKLNIRVFLLFREMISMDFFRYKIIECFQWRYLSRTRRRSYDFVFESSRSINADEMVEISQFQILYFNIVISSILSTSQHTQIVTFYSLLSPP